MRALKVGLSLVIAAGLFSVMLPNADAIFKSYGDSSYAFGTPVDDDGNQTVCSDGFEILAASTPNDLGDPEIIREIGLPTGQTDGDILVSPPLAVYNASLLITHNAPDLTSTSTPQGFDLTDADGNPVGTRYGQTTVNIVLSDTFFGLPASDPPVTKPADGIGSTMFIPDLPMPVGQDVILITNDYPGFPSFRQMTVIDCTPAPLEVDVDIRNQWIKPDRPFRNIRVHIINDGTFDMAAVDDIKIGGGSPFRERLFDVDDDGDLDLTLKVKTRRTTVECGDTLMTVTGTVDGEPFENIEPIATRCRLAEPE